MTDAGVRGDPGTRFLAPAVAGVLAVLVGLGLSVFGPYGWFVGPAVLIAGALGQPRHHRWALWMTAVGLGLTAGALVYIGLGLLGPEGPASDGGSSTAVP